MLLYIYVGREELAGTVNQLGEMKCKVSEQDSKIEGLRTQLEDSNKDFVKSIEEKNSLVS